MTAPLPAPKAVFLTVSGAANTGKSELLLQVAEYLKAAGHKVNLDRLPADTTKLRPTPSIAPLSITLLEGGL